MLTATLKINDQILTFDDVVNPGDVKKIRDLVASVGVFSTEEVETSAELVEETLSNKDAYNFIFLRDENGEIVAYTCFGEICLTKKRFDLYWIAVAQKWQNQKLASLILSKTEAEIKKLGGVKVYAETSSLLEYKPARNFYLKSGFTQVAEIFDFYKDGDNKVVFGKNL